METPVMGGEDMGYVGGAEMANAGEAEKENAAAEPHAVEEEDGVRAKRTSRPTSERENRKRSNKSARGDTNPSRDTFQEKIPTNVPQYRFTPVYPDPRGVMLSPYDRAPQLRLSDENLTVAGHKGYRLVRATHGTKTGAWYCEATIREDVPEPGLNERFTKVPGNSRIGWTRGSAYMQAPIGYDRFGYCLCSSNGDVVQMRRPKSYARPLKAGDVVGCYLSLPPLASPLKREGDVTDGGGVAKVAAGAGAKTGRDVLEWKGTKKYYYLDEDRDIQEDVHPGSTIRFYINGEAQGVAFSDIQAGTYFPTASPYFSGQVTYNFGPDFKFPLTEEPDGFPVRAISELREYDEPPTPEQFQQMLKASQFIPTEGKAASKPPAAEDATPEDTKDGAEDAGAEAVTA